MWSISLRGFALVGVKLGQEISCDIDQVNVSARAANTVSDGLDCGVVVSCLLLTQFVFILVDFALFSCLRWLGYCFNSSPGRNIPSCFVRLLSLELFCFLAKLCNACVHSSNWRMYPRTSTNPL